MKMVDLLNVDMYTPLFAPAVSYAAESGPIYIDSADLNKDGKRDLIVLNTNDPFGDNGPAVGSTLKHLPRERRRHLPAEGELSDR